MLDVGESTADGAAALEAAGLSLQSLKRAMRAEEAARLSKATQQAYARAELQEGSSWLEVTDALQRRVLTRAGVPSARMTAALFLLRTATQLFPDDAELCRIPLQVRLNRATDGRLREGDALIDIPLHRLQDGASTSVVRLSEACANLPTLLIAGSFT